MGISILVNHNHGDYASPALQLPNAQNYRIGAASERGFYRTTVLMVSQS